MIDERQLDHWWEVHGKPSLLEFLSQGEKNHRSNDVVRPHAPGQFDLKSISWKVKGGAIVTDKIPIWGTTYAYDTKGDYHEGARGNLVRYLEREGVYIHNDGGETYECKLNEWQGNTYINIRKQKKEAA